MPTRLTLKFLENYLKRYHKGILSSYGLEAHRYNVRTNQEREDPFTEICVRELRSICLGNGIPAIDDNIDILCQAINDAHWSTDKARTKACLPFALLDCKDAKKGWLERYTTTVVVEILPVAIESVVEAFEKKNCKKYTGRFNQFARNIRIDLTKQGIYGLCRLINEVMGFVELSGKIKFKKADVVLDFLLRACENSKYVFSKLTSLYDPKNVYFLSNIPVYAAYVVSLTRSPVAGDELLEKSAQLLIACHKGKWLK